MMKINKTIFILLFTFFISLTVSVCVCATLDIEKEDSNIQNNIPGTTNNNDISKISTDKTKEIFISSEEKKLTFLRKETMSLNDYVDIYVDDKENEYSFDKSGDIISFSLGDSEFMKVTGDLKGKEIVVDTSEKAAEFAKKYALTLFGDEVKSYSLKDARFISGLNSYQVVFAEYFGEENFIEGKSYFITVFTDGTIANCVLSGKLYADFDKSIVEDITKNKIDLYVNNQLRSVYGDSMDSYEISTVSIENNGEDYHLKLLINVKLENRDLAEAIYYAID